jgi:hypothetical protein
MQISGQTAVGTVTAFDRIPTARSAGGVPHQRLDRVDAIEYDRAVVVLLVSKSGNGIDDVVVARERAERFDLKASRAAVFALQKDSVWSLRGKGRLADAFFAMDDDPRRQCRGRFMDVCG